MHVLPSLLLLLPLVAPSETVRSVLATSFEKPIDLADAKTVSSVCTEVSKRFDGDPEDESADADLREEQWQSERKVTFATVYRAVVDPRNVRFDPYDIEAGALPIPVHRALPTLDGALLLTVMDRGGAAFEMNVEEAKLLVERADKKELRLAVTFQVDPDEADDLTPCWTYPKSESWSLRVRPLRYELLDSSGKAVATLATERSEELGEWLGRKGPATAIATQVVKGVVDQAALDRALNEKRNLIDGCLARAGDDASFGLHASAGGGKLQDLRIEMEASDDPQAASCLVTTLTGVPAPRASKDAIVSVLLSID